MRRRGINSDGLISTNYCGINYRLLSRAVGRADRRRINSIKPRLHDAGLIGIRRRSRLCVNISFPLLY